MKGLKTAAFLVVMAACGYAKGDTIVSGSVYNQDLSGNTSSTSSSSSNSLLLAVGSPQPSTEGYASMMANVGDMSGFVGALGESSTTDLFPYPSTRGEVSYDLSVDGTYMLTGGTGYGYADLMVDPMYWYSSSGYLTCSITFAGQTQNCAFGGVTPFYVPYNTPLNLSFDANYQGTAFENGFYDTLSYHFSNVTLVPEPSSLLLLGTGLMTLLGAARRRA